MRRDYPAPPPPRPLTRHERRTLDAELLRKLADFARPVSLEGAFEGLRPKWAEAATERLLVRGHVRELPGGLLEITDAGREAIPTTHVGGK